MQVVEFFLQCRIVKNTEFDRNEKYKDFGVCV